ncbi:MAG: hypothetical protein ABIR67_14690 [Gaiellaceae bacterium]
MLKRRLLLSPVLGIGALLLLVPFAAATVPDSEGIIHTCYEGQQARCG